VKTGGAHAGDAVVQIGLAPVEGAAVLATEFAEQLGADVQLAAAAGLYDPGVSVVGAALAAAELGATAMHDPTEGGLAAGLHEVAAVGGVALRIDPAAVRWFEPGRVVCAALGADPWATLASGCVVATFPADRAAESVEWLTAQGLDAVVIGSVEEGSGVCDLGGRALPWPERDEVARLLDS
jgi:hydrogenase expression/formation protein HypE